VEVLNAQIELLQKMFQTADIDYKDLEQRIHQVDFGTQHADLRLCNSFLFCFAKIQDKMGAKLFKSILWELRELDSDAVPMRDVLNLLEKLRIIEQASDWDKIREIRNSLAHEYPSDPAEQRENILLAMEAYQMTYGIFTRIQSHL
jgi:hypothetical protein